MFPSGPWTAHVWPTLACEKRIFIRIRGRQLSFSNGAFVKGWRAKIWTGGQNPGSRADNPSSEGEACSLVFASRWVKMVTKNSQRMYVQYTGRMTVHGCACLCLHIGGCFLFVCFLLSLLFYYLFLVFSSTATMVGTLIYCQNTIMIIIKIYFFLQLDKKSLVLISSLSFKLRTK